jgi:biopolymer transport protein ExbB/TolQ
MRSYGKPTASYLFAVFAYTKWGFSMLLGGILVAGAYVLLDRSAFFLCHGMLSRRLAFGHPGADHTGVYAAFVREAREFRAMSAEGIYSDDIVARARQAALRSELDGQELDWGRSWLEFLGTVAPTVGFLGTLVGLIKSFQDLGLGGPLTDVLEGLALSMTTSLLGALISLVFLLGAWLLGRAREVFDQRLDNLIADKQSMDR